jgi:hypothetical protein
MAKRNIEWAREISLRTETRTDPLERRADIGRTEDSLGFRMHFSLSGTTASDRGHPHTISLKLRDIGRRGYVPTNQRMQPTPLSRSKCAGVRSRGSRLPQCAWPQLLAVQLPRHTDTREPVSRAGQSDCNSSGSKVKSSLESLSGPFPVKLVDLHRPLDHFLEKAARVRRAVVGELVHTRHAKTCLLRDKYNFRQRRWAGDAILPAMADEPESESAVVARRGSDRNPIVTVGYGERH